MENFLLYNHELNEVSVNSQYAYDYIDKYKSMLGYAWENECLKQALEKCLQENNELKKEIKYMRGGRPKQNVSKELKKINTYRAAGKTIKQIAKIMKCSERRIYRLLERNQDGD